jgi:hypothetical protein
MARRRGTDEEPDPPPGALAAEARAAAIARYTTMAHRRHVLVPIMVLDVVVMASAPDELVAAVVEEMFRTYGKSDPT